VQNEDNTGRHTTIRMDCHPIQTNWCPHFRHHHYFYTGCRSWHNPPNLSWLGTGIKYAGLHTQWLLACTDIQIWNCSHVCTSLCTTVVHRTVLNFRAIIIFQISITQKGWVQQWSYSTYVPVSIKMCDCIQLVYHLHCNQPLGKIRLLPSVRI